MEYKDLVRLYANKRRKYGDSAYKHISELLREAKELHKRDWLQNPTRNRDHEQSWRAFKGKNLEKLIQAIITDGIQGLGLSIVSGNKLERARKLAENLERVKRNLVIDYGEFGMYLPDVDIVIYHPQTCKVLAVVSSKVTLRERIAQTGYWKFKLSQSQITRHIKVYFITPDEDGTLKQKSPAKKGRAIVETDLDGSYVMTEENIEASAKVKLFEHFIQDLKRMLDDEK